MKTTKSAARQFGTSIPSGQARTGTSSKLGAGLAGQAGYERPCCQRLPPPRAEASLMRSAGSRASFWKKEPWHEYRPAARSVPGSRWGGVHRLNETHVLGGARPIHLNHTTTCLEAIHHTAPNPDSLCTGICRHFASNRLVRSAYESRSPTGLHNVVVDRHAQQVPQVVSDHLSTYNYVCYIISD